jgi:hypothetical protein
MTSDTSNISVRDEYKRGLSERGQRSFCAGSTYKIGEYHRRLKRYKSVLENIGQAYCDQEMPYSFGPCAGHEAKHWCNSLPSSIAHGLGYSFVGALNALTKDGVSQNLVDSLKQDIVSEVPKLIEDGEQARIEFRNFWLHTAPRLGTDSSLDEFIDRTSHLVGRILISVATDWNPSHER